MTEQTKQTVSEDDYKKLQEEMSAAKQAMVSEEVQKKISEEREKAKNEALAEAEAKRKLEELEKQNRELQEKMEAQQRAAAEKLEQLTHKVNDMVGSKAVVRQEPRATAQTDTDVPDVDKWSDDKVNAVEEESARAFFGHDAYEQMLKERY